MRLLIPILLISIPVLSISQKVQKTNLKFGDIKAKDFEPTVYEVDSNASAVVLADIGDSKFEGNNHGDFSIIFKRHKRIRLLNKNGFDAASIQIPIYVSGNKEERVDNLEAVTYNFEKGQVVATKLDKNSIFKDKLNKNYSIKKFTFPNLKEGSIIEFQYTLKSPFYFNLQPWEFQGGLPRIWTEYSVTIPGVFDFVFLQQGYRSFDLTDTKTSSELYSILIPGQSASDRSEVVHISSPTITQVWGMANVPGLKDEAFTSTIDNHIQKIQFQLREIRIPGGKPIDVIGSWSKLVEDLLKDEDFGATLDKSNGFFDVELKKVINGASTDHEIAKKVYEYVRDNFTCTNYSAKYLSAPMRKTFQTKNGNVADLNLMLTAMLKSQGFAATPVLLSTKDHGKAYEQYPLLSKFNYVISRVKIGEDYYLLDASQSKLGFGKLSEEAYNGYGRIIDQSTMLVELTPDTLKESKITSVFIINDESNKRLAGSFTSALGYFESFHLRNTLSKQTQDDYFKDIRKAYNFDIKLENPSIENIKLYEEPVNVKYDFAFYPEEEIIYLNPMFTEAQKENPFKSAERMYPIEMPYTINETYILNIDIPTAYKVEEIPKSTRVKLNEDEGMFEYIISAVGNKIQLRSKVIISKATFDKEDYQTLRDFFSMIVNKHNEQIVLKKI